MRCPHCKEEIDSDVEVIENDAGYKTYLQTRDGKWHFLMNFGQRLEAAIGVVRDASPGIYRIVNGSTKEIVYQMHRI